MFDVLMSFLDSLETGEADIHNADEVIAVLKDAGLKGKEVDSVVSIIEKVLQLQRLVKHTMPHGGFAIRYYTEEEKRRLDPECRGMLLHLERVGLLPPELRESVIEQVMTLNEVEFDAMRLRLLVLLVLFQSTNLDNTINRYEQLAETKGVVIN